MVTVAIVGAGNRGFIYGSYAEVNPSKVRVVAVAEPNDFRRESFAKRFGIIDPKKCFKDWRELAAEPHRVADAVLICVQDAMHAEAAVAFAAQKYHILLEKPMAVSLVDCVNIFQAVEANNVMLAVGHVLRYTSHNKAIRDVITSGELGRVINIQHLEPIGFYHFAHSYVRGNWRNEAQATFSLMAKSCHDIDLISYFFGGERCLRVSSFGNLTHFSRANKPAAAGTATRCISCPFEQDCAYSAKKIYLKPTQEGYKGWPVDVITDVVDIENVTEALQNGPYGRCVYDCDNDVVDSQVVNMEFAGGQTASFTMMAFTKMGSRKTRIFGTEGELESDGQTIVVNNFLTRSQRVVQYSTSFLSGHDGGDYALMEAFVTAVETKDPSALLSGAGVSLASHLLVFAAENARRTSSVVHIDDFCKANNVPISAFQ